LFGVSEVELDLKAKPVVVDELVMI
jgi:hypothetical protein